MKKFISLLLALILTFSVSSTAMAAYTATPCTCGHDPIIYVYGFGVVDLVANPGTEDSYDVFMPESDKVMQVVRGLIPSIVQVVFLHNYKSFARTLAKAAKELFGEIACDQDGNPVNDYVDVRYRYSPYSYHGANTRNIFCYDWREDVFDIAAELNTFIEETKRLTRHDKVTIECESMGGAVTMTYIKEYGTDSLNTVIMQSSAFNGLSLVGDLFTGDMDVKTANVIQYVGDFLEGNDNEYNFYRLLIKRLGFLAAPIVYLLDRTLARGNEILFADCLREVFGNIPGLWTFVPQEDYEDAKKFLLDETKNAVLIEKIDRYHYGVMDHTKELLDGAMANGVKLAIISNYGKAGIPVGKHAALQSDFLIDTRRTSLGATCAEFGKTLGKDYAQKVPDGHNHVSCDNEVDASTCMYPEYTWFVKDMNHTWFNGGYSTFTYYIAGLDSQPTVHDNPLYPQFMVCNHDTRSIEPLTPANSNNRPTDVNWKELIQMYRERTKK